MVNAGGGESVFVVSVRDGEPFHVVEARGAPLHLVRTGDGEVEVASGDSGTPPAGWILRVESDLRCVTGPASVLVPVRTADGSPLAPGSRLEPGSYVEIECGTSPVRIHAVEGRACSGGASCGRGKLALLQAGLEFLSSIPPRAPLEAVVERVLEGMMEVFEAERGMLLLRRGRRYVPAIMAGYDGEPEYSRTILRRIMRERAPLIHHQAGVSDAIASLESSSIQCVLAAPILSPRGRVEGVLYLDSRMMKRLYTDEDAQALGSIAAMVWNLIGAASYRERLERSVSTFRNSTPGAGAFVASSPRMREIDELCRLVAEREATTLVLGESGTGKEVVARRIHALSRRRNAPFVAVNCMALAEGALESELFGHVKGAFTGADKDRRGRIESADGGILFLDEVGELSPAVQVKLLRVLEERVIERVGSCEPIPVDVMLVAATNVDLEEAVKQGRFRGDLYYRLKVVTLRLPPLRERKEEIPALVEHFLELFNERMGRNMRGVAEEAMQALLAYDWPGNVRELRNVVERAFVLERSDVITSSALPVEVLQSAACASGPAVSSGAAEDIDDDSPPLPLMEARKRFEQEYIRRVLERCNGNLTMTARLLGVPRSTLYRKLKAMNMKEEGRRPGSGEIG